VIVADACGVEIAARAIVVSRSLSSSDALDSDCGPGTAGAAEQRQLRPDVSQGFFRPDTGLCDRGTGPIAEPRLKRRPDRSLSEPTLPARTSGAERGCSGGDVVGDGSELAEMTDEELARSLAPDGGDEISMEEAAAEARANSMPCSAIASTGIDRNPSSECVGGAFSQEPRSGAGCHQTEWGGRSVCLRAMVIAGCFGVDGCAGPLRWMGGPLDKPGQPCETGDVVLVGHAFPTREALVASLRQLQVAGAAAAVLTAPAPAAHLVRDCGDLTLPTALLPREDLLAVAAEVRAAAASGGQVFCRLPPPLDAWHRAVETAAPLLRAILRLPVQGPPASLPRSTELHTEACAAGGGGGTERLGQALAEVKMPAQTEPTVPAPAGTASASATVIAPKGAEDIPARSTAAVAAVAIPAAASPPITTVTDSASSSAAEEINAQLRRYSRRTLRTLGAGGDATVSGRGVRVLCMDGGGIRGLVLVALLRRIEADTGRRAADLFDLVCGTSTGGFLALSLAAGRTLDEVEAQYRRISAGVLRRGWFTTAQQLAATGAKYDARLLEDILRESHGGERLLDLPAHPRAFAVSALASVAPALPFLWRTYQCPPSAPSRYPGTCHASVVTALRATSAAPSYFDDVAHDGGRHLDGGVVANNPAALALHEARRAFGGRPIECLVSLATGAAPVRAAPGAGAGWQGVLSTLVDSASGVARVADALADALDPGVYHRFSPEGPAFNLEMDASDQRRISDLLAATDAYIDARAPAFSALAAALAPPTEP
jgi:predicted acylesterase/phospholipase RssA